MRFLSRWRSFTLVEILASLAVFSFMMLAMVQITGLAEQAWRNGENQINNFTKARALLDVMAQDLQRGVFRPDLPAFSQSSVYANNSDGTMFLQNTGPSINAFYTRRAGVGDNLRDLSLVVYSLSLSSKNAILQRADAAIPWTAPASGWNNYLPYQNSLGPVLASAVPLDTAEGVIDCEIVFRLANGTTVNVYPGYCPANTVTAVGIGLAVVDAQTMALLTSTQLNQLHKTLAGAVTGTTSIKADWDKELNSPLFNYASYPQSMRSGLKTFERYVTCEPGF